MALRTVISFPTATALLALWPLAAAAADGGQPPAQAQAERPRPDFPAGDVAIRAWVDPERVALGDVFHLVVEVRHPAGHKVELPESINLGSLTQAAPLEHTLTQAPPGTSADPAAAKTVVESFRFSYQAFKLEDVETPTLQFHIPALAGTEEALVVDPLPVSVERLGLPGEDQKPAPMAPGVLIRRKDPRFLAWPPLLAGHGLLWLLAWWLERRRPVPPSYEDSLAAEALREPPHVRAFRELEALRAMGLVEQGKTDEFVDRAVNVLRGFLEHAYRVPVLEQTTGEAMAALAPAVVKAVLEPQRRTLGRLDVETVRATLAYADGVKFARAHASTADCADVLGRVMGALESTRPPEDVPPLVRTPSQEAAP